VAEVKGRTRSETGKAHLLQSPARIRNQVDEIIVTRMTDRQLDETPLTFADLARIEDAFVRVLVGIFHVRPKYPQITVKG
jgi:membrane-associated HD superfamily phosphohydrolase